METKKDFPINSPHTRVTRFHKNDIERLQKHFKPDPSPEKPAEKNPFENLKMGERVDAIVVVWNPSPNPETGWAGFARPTCLKRIHGVRNALYFKSKHIVTTGEETLKPGSMIRGIVTLPTKPGSTPQLTEVEIYKEQQLQETQQTEPEVTKESHEL